MTFRPCLRVKVFHFLRSRRHSSSGKGTNVCLSGSRRRSIESRGHSQLSWRGSQSVCWMACCSNASSKDTRWSFDVAEPRRLALDQISRSLLCCCGYWPRSTGELFDVGGGYGFDGCQMWSQTSIAWLVCIVSSNETSQRRDTRA